VPSDCQRRLSDIATFRPLPPLVGPGECGASDAVLLETVILPDRAEVTIAPPATLRCSMAEALAAWIRDDVAPAALKLGAPLRGLDEFDSYECRGRNQVAGAKISEHGRANAIDVGGIKLAGGRAIVLTDGNLDKDWREQIKASACARFDTVLGPGADDYHEQHIHLDLIGRPSGLKLCEWDIRGPIPQAEAAPAAAAPAPLDVAASPIPAAMVPLPRPRPPAAGGTWRRARAQSGRN
jgi:hypothetical protein